MDAHSTRQLGNARDGEFYLLASRHDKVAKLIDDDHDVWHELMPVVGIEFTFLEFLVVFLDITGAGLLEQIIAGIHLHAEALQRLHYLVYISNDGFICVFVTFNLCQEMVDDGIIDREFHFLGVDHYNLQLSRMFFVE